MKKTLSFIGTGVIFIGIIAFGYVFMFTDGIIQSKYNNTVGIKVENSKRNMYEHSATYIEAKAQELSKEKLELAKTKDKASRTAIIEMLVSDCANLDENDLNDASLRMFLEQIRNGEIK